MDTKRNPGRPPKPDAKVSISLRVRPEVLAGYQARGTHWRAEMEMALVAGLDPATPEQITKPRAAQAKPAVKAAAAAPPANPERLSVSLPFGGDMRRGPIQKTGKR